MMSGNENTGGIKGSAHPEILCLLNWIQGFQTVAEDNSATKEVSPGFNNHPQLLGVVELDQTTVSWLLFDRARFGTVCWKLAIPQKLS